MNFCFTAPQQPDLVLLPLRERIVHASPLTAVTPLLMELPEISHDLEILETNFGSQGVNELIKQSLQYHSTIKHNSGRRKVPSFGRKPP